MEQLCPPRAGTTPLVTFAPVAYEQVVRQMARWLDAGFGHMCTGRALCAHVHEAALGLGTCALAGRPCGSLVQRSAGAWTDGWDGDSGERGEGRMPKRACSGHMCTRYILFVQSEPSALIRGYWDNIIGTSLPYLSGSSQVFSCAG